MIAKAAGSRFCILDCKAPKALLNQRIRTRQREQAGPSDADETVLAFQINVREPLQAYERIQTLTLDMSLSQDIPALLNQINQLPSFTHSKT
jgi:predicted kinase